MSITFNSHIASNFSDRSSFVAFRNNLPTETLQAENNSGMRNALDTIVSYNSSNQTRSSKLLSLANVDPTKITVIHLLPKNNTDKQPVAPLSVSASLSESSESPVIQPPTSLPLSATTTEAFKVNQTAEQSSPITVPSHHQPPSSVPETPAQTLLSASSAQTVPQTDKNDSVDVLTTPPTHGNPDEIKQPRSCFKMKLISTIAIIAGALLAIVGTILFPFMPPVGIGCWIGAGSLFTSGLGTKAVISCVDPTNQNNSIESNQQG